MPIKAMHIHRLKRHSYSNGTKVYFCTLPDCHYKVDVPLALGKRSICNMCGEEFIMSEYSIKLAKPHCSNCGKIKVKNDDGTAKFISKNRPIEALADMGQKTISSLKERLGRVTTLEKDEDI